MNHWPDYPTNSDCLIDSHNDTSPPTLAAVTSSCLSDVTSRCTVVGHRGADHLSARKPTGLKKCFHCPFCRYSTDRKNNLKRHIGTMHRDYNEVGAAELGRSRCHVVVHRERAGCDKSGAVQPRPTSVLLDDFAGSGDVITARTDDVGDSGTDTAVSRVLRDDYAETGDVIASGIDDVGDSGTRPLPIAARSDTKTDDVIEAGTDLLPVSPIADFLTRCPRFEPRPQAAYGCRSSRMFFYDRLRCTHSFGDINGLA